jgi:hypothetical protein
VAATARPIWARSISIDDLGALGRRSETVRAQKPECEHPRSDLSRVVDVSLTASEFVAV